ncbi:MAG: cupin domain-containing protein [Acidimicrobiia bacterium]|nr:cupin domain-containing protein [Acidimicrobiia bacterium]
METELNGKLDGIGNRLRVERKKAGISQRELARRLGLSPSLISQIEGGLSNPSVGTLYAIVTELGLSLDRIIRGDQFEQSGTAPATTSIESVVRPHQRKAIDLDSGVRWEELSTTNEDGVDFLEAIYEVGGASTPDTTLMRHHGREYGYIVSGTLSVQIGFVRHDLGPGDSIAFDSTEPHRLFNDGDVPVRAIWFVAGRGSDHRNDPLPG